MCAHSAGYRIANAKDTRECRAIMIYYEDSMPGQNKQKMIIDSHAAAVHKQWARIHDTIKITRTALADSSIKFNPSFLSHIAV